MYSSGNAIECQRDSKRISGNGDGHLHSRKDIDGEMVMATSTIEEMWMTTEILEKMRMATSTLNLI